MLYLLLLAVLSRAEYQGYFGYSFTSYTDAEAECIGVGLSVCTPEQLFRVVYGDDDFAVPTLCRSGYMDVSNSDDSFAVGWFHNDDDTCSGSNGWQDWSPSNPDVHCCSDFEGYAINWCEEYVCGTGLKSLDDLENIPWLTDGDDECCEEWAPSDLYKKVGRYEYATWEDAEAACVDKDEDYTLCTYDQIVGVEEADVAEICSSGWYQNGVDENGDATYTTGWYVSQAHADAGLCNSQAGDRTWQYVGDDDIIYGTAHCCIRSYYPDSKYRQSLPDEYTLQDAVDYCSALSYQTSVCTKNQLETVSLIEQTELCKSGAMVDDETGEMEVGWWQGVEASCSVAGYNGWDHSSPAVHCCLDYVWIYAAPTYQYHLIPDGKSYPQSDYTTAELAEAGCSDYDESYQLCTWGQVAYAVENAGDWSTEDKVSWAWKDGEASSGYWSDGEWQIDWQPTNGNPMANCCQADMPAMEMAPPTLEAYYNGGGGSYKYATEADAAAMCDADNGYSLCSRNQVIEIVSNGVELSDGTIQQEDSLCYQGWVTGDEYGWYQIEDNACGEIGWNDFNMDLRGYHCCLPFEAGTQAPTASPVIPLFMTIGNYNKQSSEDALAACQGEDDRYDLCSDNEIYTIATQGYVSPDESMYTSIEAMPQLCYSGWTNPETSAEFLWGWYNVDGSCAPNNAWEDWAPSSDENEHGVRAGSFCCVTDALVDTQIVFGLTTAAPTTQEPTTEAPETDAPTTEAPVTDAPTTAAPVTDAPTTAAPETDAPTTAAPVTDAPTTEAPVTDAPTTEEPTNSPTEEPTEEPTNGEYTDFPSAVTEPADCNDIDFVPAGFEDTGVKYCSDTLGLIYLNGVSTCMYTEDYETEAEMEAALQYSWDNNFSLGTDTCESKSYDQQVDDQLFVTNEMVNDLEDDIDALESSLVTASDDLAAYIDDWSCQVSDLIDLYKDNYSEDIASQLSTFQDDLTADVDC